MFFGIIPPPIQKDILRSLCNSDYMDKIKRGQKALRIRFDPTFHCRVSTNCYICDFTCTSTLSKDSPVNCDSKLETIILRNQFWITCNSKVKYSLYIPILFFSREQKGKFCEKCHVILTYLWFSKYLQENKIK